MDAVTVSRNSTVTLDDMDPGGLPSLKNIIATTAVSIISRRSL